MTVDIKILFMYSFLDMSLNMSFEAYYEFCPSIPSNLEMSLLPTKTYEAVRSSVHLTQDSQLLWLLPALQAFHSLAAGDLFY